jgi:hypothetical protein
LVQRLHEVTDLCQDNCNYLDQSQEENGHWLRKLIWAAKGVLHHVNAISGLRYTLPVKDQDCEEEAKVDSCIVFIASVECFKHKDRDNKSHLDYEDENGFVEDINLVTEAQSELFLRLYEECAI